MPKKQNNNDFFWLSAFVLTPGASLRYDCFLVSMSHPLFSQEKMSYFSKLSRYLHFWMCRNTFPLEYNLHSLIHQGRLQEHRIRRTNPCLKNLRQHFHWKMELEFRGSYWFWIYPKTHNATQCHNAKSRKYVSSVRVEGCPV